MSNNLDKEIEKLYLTICNNKILKKEHLSYDKKEYCKNQIFNIILEFHKYVLSFIYKLTSDLKHNLIKFIYHWIFLSF